MQRKRTAVASPVTTSIHGVSGPSPIPELQASRRLSGSGADGPSFAGRRDIDGRANASLHGLREQLVDERYQHEFRIDTPQLLGNAGTPLIGILHVIGICKRASPKEPDSDLVRRINLVVPNGSNLPTNHHHHVNAT